jgi:hypothetical protein
MILQIGVYCESRASAECWRAALVVAMTLVLAGTSTEIPVDAARSTSTEVRGVGDLRVAAGETKP